MKTAYNEGGTYEKKEFGGKQFYSSNTKTNILNTAYTDLITCNRAWRRGNYHQRNFWNAKRDRNLQNISQTIATSPLLDDMKNSANTEYLTEYFDSLQKSLGDIDAISIVSVDNVRLYHTNHALIGTTYDGTLPIFEDNEFYAEDNDGPSGKQRRA